VTARRLALVVMTLLAGVSLRARAQRPGGIRPSQPSRPPAAARPDTARGKGDSVTVRDTVNKATFAPPDSVMMRLLNTPNSSVTQYQGEKITFDAQSRGVALTKKAIVQRDSELVKSDSTITYSGSGSTIRVNSRANGHNVFVTPGQAPLVSSGAATYNLANRRAVVNELRTSLPENGQIMQITGERVVIALGDSAAKNANDATYYLRDGTITSCDDSIPDYYFRANEIKRTGSFVVARPAILYISDVPVMWLPFLFQDIRGGRHSGILTPNFGVSDIVRNSPSYRRQVEGLGYYWAISDYLDAMASLDWRSSAGQVNLSDPGFTRYNGELRYRWVERYVTGSLAASQTSQGTFRNTAISWGHSQDFTRNTSLRMDINYASNTQLQRLTTVNPFAVLSTIRSAATYHEKMGPFDFTLGGTRSQSPGRTQTDMTFPTLSITTAPLTLANWLSWTPNFSYTSTQRTGIDQPSPFSLLKFVSGDTIATDSLKGSAYDSNLRFDTPLQIFGYNLGNSFSIVSYRNNFPESEIVTDSTGKVTEKVFATTYGTSVDWTPSFTLPPVGRNNFNLTPSLSLGNVESGAPFWIRNHRTGGQWVSQSKRPTFGLSASPTLFGLFGGFGPFTRIRHSITPTFTYSFAPASSVSNEFLAALGRSKFSANGDSTGYLGDLRQNSMSFQLSTNLEGKARSFNDSNPEGGEKLKLLSVQFSPLSYDFERAKATHKAIRGLTTETFNTSLSSDLLPGLNLGVNYSLFRGSTISDTAQFSPFLTSVSTGISFSNTSNPLAVLQRLFGAKAAPPPNEGIEPQAGDRYERQIASQPVAGRSAQNAGILPYLTKGWNASFTFSASRQRPVTGLNVVQFDPATLCSQFNTPLYQLLYQQCVARELATPSPVTPVTSGVVGAPVYLVPNVTTLSSNLNFNVTEHWSASWNTAYDFEHKQFASQIVSLQRDLHDWRAIFAFTQSPTGSFAFNFLVSLKAEPDLKFDYHKATYKNLGY
jgi:LptD protein